ncbi:MAG: hypothetical protein ACJATT_005469 [Myxococcota bacterium]|jgi:hypothetical protein
MDLAVPVTLFGVNGVGFESGNADFTDGRDIGLLQDTAEEDAWTQWAPTYRDVVILNADNEVVGIYNLTVNSLAVAENYEALTQLLIDATTAE